jgi:Hg(II)-responsive transcriptional regulator
MLLTISQIARAAAVNVQTIRYYERRGLFPPASRTPAGYRQYGQAAVRRLRFVKRAQTLGFTLQEIEQLLALRARGPGICPDVQRQLRGKIAVVDQKLRELEGLRRVLERLSDNCLSRDAIDECPVLEALEEGEV